MHDPMKQYRQTADGDFDSRPRAGEVLAQMEGHIFWQQEYANRGHGEYIDNVCELAAALAQSPTRVDVRQLIENLVPIDR